MIEGEREDTDDLVNVLLDFWRWNGAVFFEESPAGGCQARPNFGLVVRKAFGAGNPYTRIGGGTGFRSRHHESGQVRYVWM